MSGSSNLDSFHNGWLEAVQLLLCGVLPPGLVQFCSQHSCVVAVKLFFFFSRLVSVHVAHPYSSIDTIAAWKKRRFILSVRSDFHMTDRLSIAVHAFVSRVSESSIFQCDNFSFFMLFVKYKAGWKLVSRYSKIISPVSDSFNNHSDFLFNCSMAFFWTL